MLAFRMFILDISGFLMCSNKSIEGKIRTDEENWLCYNGNNWQDAFRFVLQILRDVVR